MKFIYQFPLFDSMLRGSLSPLRAENSADTNFKLRVQEQLIGAAKDEGLFALHYSKPIHPKQEYYRRALLSETFAYCNELRHELLAETNQNIRAFYREIILDRHLTTCLQQLGELIETHNLACPKLKEPEADSTHEERINSWCFHLLKVCLAKAYLEVQEVLADVMTYKMCETELYSTYLHELAPVNCFLTKRDSPLNATEKPTLYAEPLQPESRVAAPSEPVAAVEDMAFLTTEEVAAILKSDKRTITRKLQSGIIKGRKEGGKWLIDKKWFENYMQSLTNKST